MALSIEQITPAVIEVAEHIRVRTRDIDGVEQGTFTDGTRPTAAQASTIAARAARHVSLAIGDPYRGLGTNADFIAAAKDAAALYAALQIETSFFADGSRPDDGVVEQLGLMFREQIAALTARARNNQTGGSPFHSIQQVTDATPTDDDE